MKRITISFVPWLLTASLSFIACSLFARTLENSSPPPNLPDINNLSSTLSSPPATKTILGSLVIDFERTTLGDVLRSAGVGAIQHRGDAGDSKYWICFTASSSTQLQRIWIASGELGGPKHTVNSFYASSDGTDIKESPLCPELPTHLLPVSFANSIWLGSSSDQLKKSLGEPSARKEKWWLYSYSGKVAVNGFDQLALFGAHIVDGKVTALFASQATTN